MRILVILALLSFYSCKAQEKIDLKYIGYTYKETDNDSFINRELRFLNHDKDTLKINIKMPFDRNDPKIINPGIYYNCNLKENSTYILTLKKVCINNIPDSDNSYYKINGLFKDENCSEFKELKKNTPYLYQGNYGKYVDINNILYEVINVNPNADCMLPH